MRSPSLLCVFAATLLAGCASFKPPAISYDDPPEPAVLQAEPPKPVEVVELPKPLPLPGQLKPLPGRGLVPEPRDPRLLRDNQGEKRATIRMRMAGVV